MCRIVRFIFYQVLGIVEVKEMNEKIEYHCIECKVRGKTNAFVDKSYRTGNPVLMYEAMGENLKKHFDLGHTVKVFGFRFKLVEKKKYLIAGGDINNLTPDEYKIVKKVVMVDENGNEVE